MLIIFALASIVYGQFKIEAGLIKIYVCRNGSWIDE